MTQPTARSFSFGRILGHAVFALVALAVCAWTWAAMSVHLTGEVFYACFAAVVIAAVITFGLRFRARRWGWLGLMSVVVLVGVWYQTIRPSNDRDWAFDVAHGVEARVDGDRIDMSNVRNFTWQDDSTAIESWENRTYDLTKLQSVDMFTSVWDNPDIAHLLVGFGFSDGQRVVFSVETRKERDEYFNVKGGFVRQFELVLIAATEDDIVKLRTNHREEDVRLYPVKLNEQQRRDLFMSYVDLAQTLQTQPAFYNTITANCTTMVYNLAKVIKPNMVADWRLILSGHLPKYVDAMGGFEGEIPIEQRMDLARITDKALTYDGPNYSAAIRQAAPSL